MLNLYNDVTYAGSRATLRVPVVVTGADATL